MGRKSRRKRERRKARRDEKPVKTASSGYLGMAVIGFVVGLLLGIVFGKTILAWLGSAFLAMVFFLVINRVMLFFGFGPNSGSTSAVYHNVSNYEIGGGSGGGSSGIGGAGGGGGGGAG